MRWVAFDRCKPAGKHYLITRATHPIEEGDLLQEWPEWTPDKHSPDITHWWDGEEDIRVASMVWRLLYSDKFHAKEEST